jgi:hypothetical protein
MDLERRRAIGRGASLRLAAVLLLTSASLPLDARPTQLDATTQLLTDLTHAVERADADAFRALGTSPPSMPSTLVFLRMVEDGPSQVALRERQREVTGRTTRTVVDLFSSQAQTARLATWEVTSRSSPATPARDDLIAVTEFGGVKGLRRLLLDTTTAYTVRDFTFAAPDVTLRMRRGIAFLAGTGTWRTAMVLHGEAELTFSPPVPAERLQLRLFSGRDALVTRVSDAFIRVPPGALDGALATGALRATPPTSGDAARAAALFADRATRTFTLNLGDLTSEAWSLDPPAGSAVIEFRAPAFGWLTYARTPGDVEDVALFDRTRRRQVSLYASTVPHEARNPADRDYDVRHYDVDVRIDPARAQITGRTAVTVHFVRPPATGLTLRLAESLLVTSVSSPQLGRLLAMRVVGQNQLLVSLPSMFSISSDIDIDIAYTGRLDPQTLDREALTLQSAEGADELPPLLPPTARFVYSTRRAWYPQAPFTDYATATLRVTTPDDLSVVASGRRDERPAAFGSALAPPASGAWRTTRFDADRPVRYLSCVISSWQPVGSVTAAVPGVPGAVAVDAVATAPQAKASADLAAEAARILSFYAAEVGEAPYPTFTVASIDDDLPGGHSPAYFALVQQPRPSSGLSWRNDPVAFDRVPDFVLAHEVAHQWWGQAVGYASYHDQWLSEGLAQYFALRYITASRPPDVTRGVMARMRHSVEGLEGEGPISLGFRLGHIRGMPRVFRAVLYNKSALVLDMLRRTLGDATFAAGLRDFYATSRYRAAATDDLRVAFERASGRTLGRFFDRWVRAAALPTLHVSFRVVDPHTLDVRVQQEGDVFDMPIPIVIEYADGQRESVDVAADRPVSESRLVLRGPVRHVRVDRELTLAHW